MSPIAKYGCPVQKHSFSRAPTRAPKSSLRHPFLGAAPRPSPQRTISDRFFTTRSPSPRLRRRFPHAQLPQPVRNFPAVTATTLGRTHEAGGLGWGFIDTVRAAHTSGTGLQPRDSRHPCTAGSRRRTSLRRPRFTCPSSKFKSSLCRLCT